MYQFVFTATGFEALAGHVSGAAFRMVSLLAFEDQEGLLPKFFPDHKTNPHTKGFLDIISRNGLNGSNIQSRILELQNFFISENKIAISFDPKCIDARILVYPDQNIWNIEWQDEKHQPHPFWFQYFTAYIDELEFHGCGYIREKLIAPKIKPIMETTAEVEAFLTKRNPFYF